MQSFVWIFLGGGLGSLARYLFSIFVPSKYFPWATMSANAVSCILLGIVLSLFSKSSIDMQQKLFLATGFCGGFSTFSTFSAEIVTLFQSGNQNLAVLYMISSIVIGVLGVIGGIYLARGW